VSSSYKKSESKPFGCGRSVLANAPSAPGDERSGDYTPAQLLRMDAKFCARMERAIERGLERPPDPEPVQAA
jgi:hypothetical protein